MKKIFLIAALILTSATVAIAQPKAIGARLGWGAEVSYQHTLNEKNFIEADLGLAGFANFGIQVTGVYNFVLGQYNWTPGLWTWYAGPGASIGFVTNAALVGVVGQMGLSYEFDEIPLQLSVDIRPTIGICFGNGGVNMYGDLGAIFCPHLGVRYCF